MESTGKLQSRCPTWVINNFEKLDTAVGCKIRSPIFKIESPGNCHSRWFLELYPNGVDNQGFVSLFLNLKSCSSSEVEVDFELSLIDGDNKKSVGNRLATRHTYSSIPKVDADDKEGLEWGWKCFIKREKLMDPTNGILVDGSVSVYCRMWGFSYSSQPAEVLPQPIEESSPFRVSLWEQYVNKRMTDVTFIVGKKEFGLHKNVLAANSPVFTSMFNSHMEEADENIVTLTDCEPDTFEGFINYLYLGKVENLEKLQSSLLIIAEKYAVDKLKDICERSLAKTLSIDNAIKRLLLADLHQAAWLKNEVLDFIENYAFEVTRSADWSLLVSVPELLSEVSCRVVNQMSTWSFIH